MLVEVSQGEVDAIGLANLRDLVDNYRAELGIEMYVNLDHSPSVEAAKAGIDAGFEFIHIDLSQAKRDATDDEIIAATREVVAYARTTGALVESEPHYFGGSSNVHTEDIDYEEIRKTFSTPEGARAFVDATGIDTFAAAVGNLHGRYPVPKQLDLELLAAGPRRHRLLHQPARRQRDAGALLHVGRRDRGEQDQPELGHALRVPHDAGAPAARQPGRVRDRPPHGTRHPAPCRTSSRSTSTCTAPPARRSP